MSKRDAMHKLARAISARTGLLIETDWRKSGRSTSWYLSWSDGPAVQRMRRHVTKAARSVPGITASEVEYERGHTTDHVVAAWVRGMCREQLGTPRDFRHMAHTYFRTTSFPDDIGDDDEIWNLVRGAFDACGGPDTPEGTVIDHIVTVGINGLRVEHWLRHRDTPLPRSGTEAEDPAPRLGETELSASALNAIDSALTTARQDLLGGSPHRGLPLAQFFAAEHARTALIRQADQQQRTQALLIAADGTPLEKLSAMIGLPEQALSQRWDSDAFARDLAPLAWLRANAAAWTHACTAVHGAFRAAPGARDSLSWDARNALTNLSFAVEAGDLSTWYPLVALVPVARQLLDGLRHAPPQGTHDALHELDVLLAEFDTVRAAATTEGKRKPNTRPQRISTPTPVPST